MLRTRLRVVPHMMRACLVVPRCFTQTLLSSSFTSTSPETGIASSPSLPLALSRPAAIETFTPLGTLTGFLPTRDMASSLEHATEDFAADIGGPSLVVRHDPAWRRKDRDAEAVEEARDLPELGTHSAPRPGHAGYPADHRLAFVILQFDAEFDAAAVTVALLIAANIALALQYIEHARPDFRGGAVERGLAPRF